MAGRADRISALATRISAVVKQRGIPSGGKAGQFLAKKADTDYVTYWSDAATQPSPLVSQWILRNATTTFGDWSAGADGEVCLAPFFLPAGTYDQVAFQVTSAGSTDTRVRIIVYGSSPSGVGALQTYTDRVDVSTTGVKSIPLTTPLVVPPAGMLVWTGLVNQNNGVTKAKYVRVYATGDNATLVFSDIPGNFGDTYLGSRIYRNIFDVPPPTFSTTPVKSDSSVRFAFRRSS